MQLTKKINHETTIRATTSWMVKESLTIGKPATVTVDIFTYNISSVSYGIPELIYGFKTGLLQ